MKPTSKKERNAESRLRKLPVWIFPVMLFLFAFMLYGKTLRYGYVLDDNLVNGNNVYVQQGISGIPEILTGGFLEGYSRELDSIRPQYRPCTQIHFAVEKQLFGLSPAANHFFNVFYYALTGVLLFLLFRMALLSQNIADKKLSAYWLGRWQYIHGMLVPFLIAAFFIVHPVHTEVVANVKSRDEILCFLLLLTALLMLFRYVAKRKVLHLVVSVTAYFLALLSKENALTFLLVIPLFLFCFSNEKIKNILRLSLPYLFAAIAFLILRRLFVPASLPELDPLYNSLVGIPSLSHRVATAIFIIGKYMALLVFPHPLVWDYSYNQIPATGWANPWVILTVIISVALIVYAFRQLRNRKEYAVAILFFFISISLTSNLFIYIGSTMGERLLYAPSFAFCMLLAFLLRDFTYTGQAQARNYFRPFIFFLIVTILLIAGAYKTIDRNEEWRDNFTLFMAGVRDSPNSAKTHLALAGEITNYAKRAPDRGTASQIYMQAIKEYRAGLDIYPHDADGWFNLGIALYELKDYDEAIKVQQRAIDINPRYAKAYNNIGVVYGEKGDMKKALPYFQKAAELDANYSDAIGNIAICYNSFREYAKAAGYYERALKLNPNNENIRRNMEENRNMMEDSVKRPEQQVK